MPDIDDSGDRIDLVLRMVDASAAVVAPEDRDEDFDEYADVVRRTGWVPGFDPRSADGTAAGMFEPLSSASGLPSSVRSRCSWSTKPVGLVNWVCWL
ncbi:hypothetical protein AB0K00_22750 [Dactylosporangium sp. NPDC049525]|uniref:hypothetical protein n=1 Tax=Dactylosporangium sp. NPDC049525 TaxID=3154730 RepID=UPI00342B85ED